MSREDKKLEKIQKKLDLKKFEEYFKSIEVTPEPLSEFEKRKGHEYVAVDITESGYYASSEKGLHFGLYQIIAPMDIAVYWSTNIPLTRYPYDVQKFLFENNIEAIVNTQIIAISSARSFGSSGDQLHQRGIAVKRK